jgi:alpha-L-fucosidase
MNVKSFYTLGFLLICSSFSVHSQESSELYIPDPDTLIQKRIEDWKDLKFGLLMHWGPYSQWGIVESWSICPEDEGWCIPDTVKDYFIYKKRYEDLPKTFNPVLFDPLRWAKAAKEAGMKYVVFTTKHHDGFCMFDSKYTNYKITGNDCPFHTNPKADVTREILNAFRDEGLWTGVYFSKPDWHSEYYWWPQFPPVDRNVNYSVDSYPERWNHFIEYTHNQVMELSTNYGNIDIFWFDGGWVHKAVADDVDKPFIPGYKLTHDTTFRTEDSYPYLPGYKINKRQNQDIKMDELVSKIRKVQPDAIVVDRAVPGKNQNYLTPENQVPSGMLPYPWESCIILGGGWSFSYNAVMMPSRKLVHLLIDIVAKGGNLLLNIGPGPDGTWYEEAYARLKDIGAWLNVNGEAIFGSGVIAPYYCRNLRFTGQKDGSVYILYLVREDEKEIPARLTVPEISPEKGACMSILGIKESELKWSQSNGNCIINIPGTLRKKVAGEYAFVIKISNIIKEK